MRSHSFVVVCAMGVASTACSSTPQLNVRAADVARLQCGPGARSQDGLVGSMAVVRVEPLYSHVRSFNSAEERVNGVKLLVQPPNGLGTEQMEGILQCHSARVLLGQLDAARVPNDPFWLPERWINIDVQPALDSFAISVSADTVPDNLEVLGRATRFGRAHMQATDPGPHAARDP